MGGVRRFVEEDIPRVASLHRRMFRTDAAPPHGPGKSYETYFRRVYLTNPWADPAIPSLVYDDGRGRISGFLGIMPRPMVFRGRPLRAVMSSQFLVEPGPEAAMVAAHLARRLFSGPQDLCIADEATAASRQLWERLGGMTALMHSLFWARVLRPCQFVASRLGNGGPLARVARATIPLCRLLDSLASRVPGTMFHQSVPDVTGEDLSPKAMLECIEEGSEGRALRPVYDEESVAWLFDTLAQKHEFGPFHKIAVRHPSGERIGWYLYYQNRGGVGEVVHFGAKGDQAKLVLAHLAYHAARRGVTVLSGRLEPALMEDLSRQACFFHHRGYWVLVHSRHPEIFQAILRGEAYLTRLEGEWGMRF